MTMVDLLKMWNSKFGCYYRGFNNGEISPIGKRVSDLINTYGEDDVTEFFKMAMEQGEKDLYKFVVINDKLEDAVEEIRQIIRSKM